MPTRAALSAYAGPMPRFVVPIAQVAEPQLARAVHEPVPRHHQVRVARDAQPRARAASRLQLVELAAQHLGLDHDAVAEDAERVLVQHARTGAGGT